jgi:bacterioferritin-associated ferredoxin
MTGRRSRPRWLGEDYAKGAPLVARARAQAGIAWRMGAAVWDIRCESDRAELGLVEGEQVSVVRARHVALAGGAMERPTPFPGWTLPGVVTIGAAQTLLKDAALLPEDGVALAGQGPLLYLFAIQLLDAGVRPAALLDCAPRWPSPRDLGPLLGAVAADAPALLKGLGWRRRIAKAGVPHHFGVTRIEALGGDRVEGVRFAGSGGEGEIATGLLLVHDGVVPNTHMAVAAGCAQDWDDAQACWRPRVDDAGRTDRPGLWALGDGARIMGGEAAAISGRRTARALADALGLGAPDGWAAQQAADARAFRRLTALRRFLDAQYPPAAAFAEPADETMICRCEAVRAGEIRALAQGGCMGPNQLRAFTRAGMGPCMGRQCGALIGPLMARAMGRGPVAVGHFTARPPLKPITVGQLASLSNG